MEDLQIWEVLDPTTYEPLPLGQRGLTAVTNLFSEGSPQLSFLVGDYAVMRDTPCACGRTQIHAEGGFLGRGDDMLKVKGIAVFPSAIEAILRKMNELGDEFQIVVSRESDLDVMTLVAETTTAVSELDSSAIQEKIHGEFRAKLGIDTVVKIVPPGTLPRTEFKAKRVQDTRQV